MLSLSGEVTLIYLLHLLLSNSWILYTCRTAGVLVAPRIGTTCGANFSMLNRFNQRVIVGNKIMGNDSIISAYKIFHFTILGGLKRITADKV